MASNKRIKGITIEIGGETKGLDQALQKVNQTINKTNTELKDINKALKLDPKNTELLAQKQEVLSKNIMATRERLQQLVEAQKQMGSYSSLTEEQKEKYRALEVEITHTKASLEEMTNELKKSSKVDLKPLKEGLKKVGELAVDVSKKLLQVSGAIGGALTSVVAMGVKSYASLEQNIGGIEKLFGKSADKLIENSKKAYKTAGLSANAYMETATSFSASLLKGLRGNTEQAVKLTDRAIKDMSDNANTFGSSMDEVMNVYKALSKEQYTTLDNLRLGYAGTKTGAKQLVKDASAYAKAHKELGIQVNANSLEFNNLINAISVMQTKMGIAGTTMKEAEQTIQGSLNTLKASFDNFINGSGSPEALSEAVMNFIKNIAKTVEKLAPSILKGLVGLLKDLIPKVVKILLDLIPQLAEALTDLIDGLLDLVSKNTDGIEIAVNQLITTIVLFLTDNLPKVVDMALQLVVALANGIAESVSVLVPKVVECIMTIVNTLLDNLDLIVDTAITLIMTLANALTEPKTLDYIIEQAPIIIEKLVEALMRNAPKLSEMGLKLIYKFVEAILKILPKMPEFAWQIIKALCDGIYHALPEVLNRATDIIDTIKKELTKLPDKAMQWGKDMINGFTNGIKGMLGKVGETANNVGKKIKEFLHFSKPDRGALREYETWMPDFVKGLATSLKNSSGILESATLDLSSNMANSIIGNTSMALRSLKSGINTSLNPTINPSIAYDLNYQLMASAIKEALQEVDVELDDRAVGRFIDKTVSEEVYS